MQSNAMQSGFPEGYFLQSVLSIADEQRREIGDAVKKLFPEGIQLSTADNHPTIVRIMIEQRLLDPAANLKSILEDDPRFQIVDALGETAVVPCCEAASDTLSAAALH
jgi:hypothetical protein